MKIDFHYLGRSEVSSAGASGMSIKFAPNLARPKVFYDAELKDPLRFREAISALHDIVVGDLTFKRKDKAAYLEWKRQEDERQKAKEADLYKTTHEQSKKERLAQKTKQAWTPEFAKQFQKMHGIYWKARVQWANELSRNDPTLFRHLVPCDPVVTIAPDVVFFECFSKDESSYGCLSVDREMFRGEGGSGTGTTNVDYSLGLYEHFQTLRSYRPTRLLVDPSGFEVKVEGVVDYKEEKIDLPPSWLRGFGQLQAAMSLPSTQTFLTVEAVYSVLSYLKNHREKTGPRSIRFLLTPGKSPELILDPWGVKIPTYGPLYQGDKKEELKIWGRRRLLTLARLLPLTERIEVRLLGSGFPSVWVAHMGGMRFTLALSGWTQNDWTGGSNLDLLFGSYDHDQKLADSLLMYLESEQKAPFSSLLKFAGNSNAEVGRKAVLGSLNLLAKQGQLIYDFTTELYRYRKVMPLALSDTILGPESAELIYGRKSFAEGRVLLLKEQQVADKRLLIAKVGETSCEALFDLDLMFSRAKCTCSHFFKNRLRAGPCRHLLALRFQAQQAPKE
jgi:hypothetical protein